jgi:hypothetical protein
VLARYGGGLLPRPSEVYAFVARVRAGDRSMGESDAPANRQDLALLLRAYEFAN